MNWTRIAITFLTIVAVNSCGIYKLNDTVIPPTVKTVSVEYFENNAPIVNSSLSPILSDKLRDKFLSETTLSLVEEEGDFAISGQIVDYSVVPVSSQDNSTATINRLQITIKAKLNCESSPKLNFDSRISQFEDFDANESLSSVEDNLIESITGKLVQEVFNKATNNW